LRQANREEEEEEEGEEEERSLVLPGQVGSVPGQEGLHAEPGNALSVRFHQPGLGSGRGRGAPAAGLKLSERRRDALRGARLCFEVVV
jgi:hypothetical protein